MFYIFTSDYVLVYTEEEGKQPDPKHLSFRERFLGNLKKSKIETEEVFFYQNVILLSHSRPRQNQECHPIAIFSQMSKIRNSRNS